MGLKATELWNKIHENNELEILEKDGLHKGEAEGKQPNVSVNVLRISLRKQYLDFLTAYGGNDDEGMKKRLADIRNIAGILFLRLQQGGEMII